MRIPVNMQDFLVSTKCRLSLIQPITLYGFALHAHIYGTKIIADVIRGGKVVFEVGREPAYNFDLQRFVYYKDEGLPNLELEDGDVVVGDARVDVGRAARRARPLRLRVAFAPRRLALALALGRW